MAELLSFLEFILNKLVSLNFCSLESDTKKISIQEKVQLRILVNSLYTYLDILSQEDRYIEKKEDMENDIKKFKELFGNVNEYLGHQKKAMRNTKIYFYESNFFAKNFESNLFFKEIIGYRAFFVHRPINAQ